MTFTAGILIVGGVAAFALIFPERTLARFAGITPMAPASVPAV
jgi:hypothetical protein